MKLGPSANRPRVSARALGKLASSPRHEWRSTIWQTMRAAGGNADIAAATLAITPRTLLVLLAEEPELTSIPPEAPAWRSSRPSLPSTESEAWRASHPSQI